MELLNKIQQQLKAPKGQMNTFGGYAYRSCEDILEAVKPLLGSATLVLNDEIVQLGDRYYVKATATLTDGDKSISASAYARECLDRKGMDTSQITGATSSYARKYALNGLLLIDDTKDADTHAPVEKPKPATTVFQGTAPDCPVCGKKMKSTADAKASGKMSANGPDFSCSDYKNCKFQLDRETKQWVPSKYATAIFVHKQEPEIDLSEGSPF